MIQTSYFANYRNFPDNKKKISISRSTPKWFEEDHNALELAPSASLLKDYKDGLVDDAMYEERYFKETLSKLDPGVIAKKYKDSIFLCYERNDDFCHRQLVAKWLGEYNIPVEEVVKFIRIAVVGSRGFDDYSYFVKVMDKLVSNYKNFILVSGGAKGADAMAEKYAKEKGVEIDIYLADWDKYGKSAGYKRNYQIWENSDIGIAFWDGYSKGTKHSFQIAKKENKKLYIANYVDKKIYLN